MKSITDFIVILFILFCTDLAAQSENKPMFTFGVVADVQYADRDNAGTRYYRSSPGKFAKAVNVFNQQRVDFVLSLGDFINDGFQNFDTLTMIAAKLDMPLFHVLGNHDFTISSHGKKELFSVLNLKRPYYSFVKNKWRFIILDGNDISLYANDEGSEKYEHAAVQLKKLQDKKAPNAREWNGGVGEKQLAWLKKELAAAKRKKEKVIVACHFPLYPDHGTELLWNAAELKTLIEASPNVIAYLNGHVHKSQHFHESGVHYFSFRGMVEEDVNAFSVVSVFKNHLEIENRHVHQILIDK
jgi:3',5'-cyclic AMP phosphodiesterase CpdA